jgi:hypothetical protein
MQVITHRNTKDEYRHFLRLYNPPWSVVPVTGVPVIILVNPVKTVVIKIVGIQPWSVIDRIARHPDEFREQRQVDSDTHIRQPDTYAHLACGRTHRA